MMDIDFALNPDLKLGQTRSKERPLSEKETMQRMCALNALLPKSHIPSCDGNLFVGMFFDGTGNNEDEDYKKHEGDPRHQKHSNVVRLYHAYPDLKEKKERMPITVTTFLASARRSTRWVTTARLFLAFPIHLDPLRAGVVRHASFGG
ncbi:hypothetical protein ACQ4P5_03485 [Ralstonia sp. L16]|uniref:hypothetical protein n=1 Tax=Ralstonia sp. L16 TaxID=3423950 RepID=UPI003F794555